MNAMIETRARRATLRAVLFATATLIVALPAGELRADWISSTQDDRCNPSDVDGITQNIRDAIEASVRRAEASIQAPAAIGDLSCLNDLMNAPLDIFSNIGGLMGTLQNGLFNALPFDMDLDVTGMVCDMAAEKWGELTSGLGDLDISLDQFANTPSDLIGRIAGGGGFGSGGGDTQPSGNLPGWPGTESLIASNIETGTERTSIPIHPDLNDLPFYPEPPNPPPGEIFDRVGYMSAMQDYEQVVNQATTEYTACTIARAVAQASMHYDEWGRPIYTGVVIPTCNMPNLPTEPDINDFYRPDPNAPASPTTTGFRALGGGVVPMNLPGPQQVPAARDLVGGPVPAAPVAPSTGGARNQTIQNIWDNL